MDQGANPDSFGGCDCAGEFHVRSGVPIVGDTQCDSGNHSLESVSIENNIVEAKLKPPSKESICSIFCKICHESDNNSINYHLIHPCNCKGTMSLVHKEFLERWILESHKTSCEICGFNYILQQKLKYTGIRSIVPWLKHPLLPVDSQRFYANMLWLVFLFILSGITIWISYSATGLYVKQLKSSPLYENEINMIYGIYLLLNVLLISLSSTVVGLTFKYHYTIWKEWQNANSLYTVLPNIPDKNGTQIMQKPGHKAVRPKTATSQSDTLININMNSVSEESNAERLEIGNSNLDFEISSTPPSFFGFPRTFSLCFRVGPYKSIN